MCHLAVHLLQCQSSRFLHMRSGLLLLCFYIASLWLWRFLWIGHRRVVFAPSSESKALAKLTNNIVASRFFCTYTFKNSTESQNLWCHGSISPKAILVLPKYLLNLGLYALLCNHIEPNHLFTFRSLKDNNVWSQWWLPDAKNTSQAFLVELDKPFYMALVCYLGFKCVQQICQNTGFIDTYFNFDVNTYISDYFPSYQTHLSSGYMKRFQNVLNFGFYAVA